MLRKGPRLKEAMLKLNGADLGVVWSRSFYRQGKGPPKRTICKFTKSTPLFASGLLGPVTLQLAKKHE